MSDGPRVRIEPPEGELWMCDGYGSPVPPPEPPPIDWEERDRVAMQDDYIEEARKRGNIRVGMRRTSYEAAWAKAAQEILDRDD